MRPKIHPKYVECQVACSCGNTFTTRSTQPRITVQICSRCHPFFTGKQKLVDSAGRVEKFMRRYGKSAGGQTVVEPTPAPSPEAGGGASGAGSAAPEAHQPAADA